MMDANKRKEVYFNFLDYCANKATRKNKNEIFVKLIKAGENSECRQIEITPELSDDILYYQLNKNSKTVRLFMREKRGALNDFFIQGKYVASFYLSKNYFFLYNLN